MKKILIILVLFIPTYSLFSQIMNIEQKRIVTNKDGWAGSLGASFHIMNNKTELINTGSNIHIQYKQKRNLFLLLSSYNLVRAGDDDFNNAGHAHLRYNCKIKDWLTWEAFTQAQFNKLLDVELRALIGTGPRFKFFGIEDGNNKKDTVEVAEKHGEILYNSLDIIIIKKFIADTELKKGQICSFTRLNSGGEWENCGQFKIIGISETEFVVVANDKIAVAHFKDLEKGKSIKYKWEELSEAKKSLVNRFKLHIAILYMYEYEELENTSIINRDHRISSYVSLSLKLAKNLELINTTYFQPKINDIEDYRIASQTSLNLLISKRLKYKLSYNYLFDANPPSGITSDVYSFMNGITYSF